MSLLKHTAITKLLKHVFDKVVTHPDEQTPAETSRKKTECPPTKRLPLDVPFEAHSYRVFFFATRLHTKTVGKSSFVANVKNIVFFSTRA
jgi:hypothetical protein